MKLKFPITALFLFQFIVQYCYTQTNPVQFSKLDSINGSPIGKINAICQDPSGIMWFCGQEQKCLYRYDGNRITSFRHESNNPNSLGFIGLETIYADGQGFVWIGGESLDRYDPSTGVFTHYISLNKDYKDFGQVHTILKDHKGNVWVGTSNGLYRLDGKTGKFIPYLNNPANPKSLSNNYVNVIYEDKKGVLWFGTGLPWKANGEGGLNRLNPDGSFTRYQHDPGDPKSLMNNKIRAILEDSRGEFWVGTGDECLHIMNRERGTFDRYPFDPRHPDHLSAPQMNPYNSADGVTFIEEDKSGSIWIGSYLEGLSRYDRVTGRMTRYKMGNGYPDSATYAGFISRDGTLWVATDIDYSPVLYRADTRPGTIAYTHCGNQLNKILADDGQIWVSTSGGLLQYDENRNLIHRYKFDPRDPSGISSDTVHALFKDPHGDTIWVGTGHGGIEILNTASKAFSRFVFGKKQDPTDFTVGGILEDKGANLWLATFGGGLIRYNRNMGSVKRWLPDPADSASIGSTFISLIFEDRERNIWVGTFQDKQGICKLNSKTGKFHCYLPGIIGRNLYEDQEGVLWASTNNGLFRYNKEKDDFFPFFDPESGVSNTHSAGMVEDQQRNLWLSTVSGIVRINRERNNYFLYGNKFGVSQAGDFFIGSISKTARGQILVGNMNGFYAFYPEELAVDMAPLNIAVTDFFLNKASGSTGRDSSFLRSANTESALSLAYDQNNFGFGFIAKDHYSPEPVRYFTMLENYEPVWRQAGVEKTVYYFNLAPGDYIFRIKAYDSNETKGEKQIRIHVSPPWWKTWWAYGLYAVLLSLAGFTVYSIQKRRIISRERQKAQQFELAQAKEIEKAYHELRATQAQLIQSEKMASLGEMTAGIAHEIQNPLNFVNNFSQVSVELLEEMKEDLLSDRKREAMNIMEDLSSNLEKISHHGQRADAIVKSMLQHSRTSAGQKEPTDINALADEYLRLSYQGLRARDKSFQATLKTEFDASVGKVQVVPQDIGRVLLNLYNNAFYAVSERKMNEGDGFVPTVSVSTKRVGKMIELTVGDNGSGIPAKVREKIFQPFFTTKPTGQGTGLGLSLSYDIIKAHGGGLKVKQQSDDKQAGENGGSEFIIELPIT